MSCTNAREELAVALLTGGDVPPEIRAHLDTCVTCAGQEEALRALPDLLATTSPDAVAVSERPSELGLARLLSAAGQERRDRRRRLTMTMAAAAVVVVAAVAGVLAWRTSGGDTTPPVAAPTVSAHASSRASGVSGTLTLAPAAWGSELTLAVNGVPPGTRCTLEVVGTDGSRVRAATWWATYAGTAKVQATVAVAVDAISRVDVVDDATHEVLLPVPVT